MMNWVAIRIIESLYSHFSIEDMLEFVFAAASERLFTFLDLQGVALTTDDVSSFFNYKMDKFLFFTLILKSLFVHLLFLMKMV